MLFTVTVADFNSDFVNNNPKFILACAQLDESVFSLDECLSLNRRLSSSPFVPLDKTEVPEPDSLVALDAEFVSLNQVDCWNLHV